MRQGNISEFEQGRRFGRQELLMQLLNNMKYQAIKEGDFCITLNILQGILNEETNKNGKS